MQCISLPHITASVFINDDEWLEDVRTKLRQAPHEPISRYRHNRTGEDNGYAHLKRQAL